MMTNTMTVMTVQYIDGSEECFFNVHPDNKYADEGGFLVIEFTEDCLPIVYIPIINLRRFDTVEVSDPCGKVMP